MAKRSYKAKCERTQIQETSANAAFSIGGETVPGQPGQPPQRLARTVINITSGDAKEMEFISSLKPGKEYALTIE